MSKTQRREYPEWAYSSHPIEGFNRLLEDAILINMDDDSVFDPIINQCAVRESNATWPKLTNETDDTGFMWVLPEVKITKDECTCDTRALFAVGCTCGFLKKEKFGL